MRRQILTAAAIATLIASPCAAASRLHLPSRPSTASLLSAGPVMPNGTLIRDVERLRTLELDELAPLHVRVTIHF